MTWEPYSRRRAKASPYFTSAWGAHVALFVSTMLLAFGNLSGNSLSFAYSILSLGTIQTDFDPPAMRLVITVQVIIITFAFAVHWFSRRGGIWLNNAFAILKIGLLTLIITVGLWAPLSRAPKQGEIGSNYWRDPGLMSSGGHGGNNQGSSGLVGALLAISESRNLSRGRLLLTSSSILLRRL
jgi:amino acid permease